LFFAFYAKRATKNEIAINNQEIIKFCELFEVERTHSLLLPDCWQTSPALQFPFDKHGQKTDPAEHTVGVVIVVGFDVEDVTPVPVFVDVGPVPVVECALVEPVFVVDEEVDPVFVVDEDVEPVFAVDEEVDAIFVVDEEADPVFVVDEDVGNAFDDVVVPVFVVDAVVDPVFVVVAADVALVDVESVAFVVVDAVFVDVIVVVVTGQSVQFRSMHP